MLSMLYFYLLAGLISALGVTAGLLLAGRGVTNPIRSWLWLALVWPLTLLSTLKYYVFRSSGDGDEWS